MTSQPVSLHLPQGLYGGGLGSNQVQTSPGGARRSRLLRAGKPPPRPAARGASPADAQGQLTSGRSLLPPCGAETDAPSGSCCASLFSSIPPGTSAHDSYVIGGRAGWGANATTHGASVYASHSFVKSFYSPWTLVLYPERQLIHRRLPSVVTTTGLGDE